MYILIGIKRLHDDLGVNIAKVIVTAAKHNLVLLMKNKENILSSYYCLYTVSAARIKVNAAEELFTHKEEMDLETAQTTTTAKLSILKHEKGNLFKPVAQTTTNADGSSTSLIPGPVTTKEKAQKKNDVKARSMLLMALTNEHLMTFNQYKDAKTLFAAIQTRFGGFRRLNKPDLNTMSFDDLYNNFKIVEKEVKRTASSSLSSQNMDFVSSPSSTNKVNIAYGVSTSKTQVSPASTQVSTASTQVNTANLSDDTVYAFLASQPNKSQFVYKDLEQIHEDEIEEIDLKCDTAGYDKSKVECFNCHKMGHFARECRGLRNQDSRNKNQDNSRRTINVEETSSKAMVAINSNLSSTKRIRIEFNNSEFNLANYKRGLAFVEEQLVFYKKNELEFEGYEPKTSKSVSEDICNEVREIPDAPLVKELVPRGNQRNWNNQKSQQLGSNFVMYNKACFVCGSFDHMQAHCNYHQRERVESRNNYTRVNYNYSAKKAQPGAYRNMAPRAVLMKTGLRSFNTARPKVVNTARPNSAVVNAVRENQVNAVKASTWWVWRPTKLNSASITLKRHNYVDARGKSKHMTRNMSYLSDFKEFDGGYVTFGGGAKGRKITGKGALKTSKLDFEDVHFVKELQFNIFSVSQMCDKKNIVLFTDTGCFVLSPDFKLVDES
ncbi:ribonuclease H-like domain-containing protein [Tanacetum coccineum]